MVGCSKLCKILKVDNPEKRSKLRLKLDKEYFILKRKIN